MGMARYFHAPEIPKAYSDRIALPPKVYLGVADGRDNSVTNVCTAKSICSALLLSGWLAVLSFQRRMRAKPEAMGISNTFQ